MSNRAERNGAALSLLVISALVLGALFAFIANSPAARAGPCDQVGGVITGDWTITTPQTCSGIVYYVDGTININAGGSLNLSNGGIIFTKDAANPGYSLNVNAGGSLILDASYVTTDPVAIAPYVQLAFTVSGASSALTMKNGAFLKFPGWFNATGATLNITDSRITGFEDSELAGTGLDTDSNNDAPLIAWSASTNANLYRSRIERVYEGTVAGHIRLSTSSNLYAYDSYIGVDYSDDPARHNTLQVDGTSNAYLYGVTIDRAQDPPSMSTWQPAFLPAAGGSVYIMRWARVTAIDSTNFAVSGTALAATLSPSANAAQYPDNGMLTTPSQRTLWFLGRTLSGANAWDRTGPGGEARIPLYTDQITNSSLPNADSFGNYQVVATYTGPPLKSASGGVSFPAYPSLSLTNNTRQLTLTFSDLVVRTGPDLELRQSDYPTTVTVIQNQPFTVQAMIHNAGQTTATSTIIAAYLDGNLSDEVARVGGLTIGVGGSLSQTLNVDALTVAGAHTLMLSVDPDNLINEGGAAQENNNWANITLFVQPPPAGFVAIASPERDQAIQPGSPLVVNGFVREPDSTGIAGVLLTIELRHQGNLVASSTTTSVAEGFFQGTLDVPSGAAEGTYDLSVTPSAGSISPEVRPVVVQRNVSFLDRIVPILGISYLWFLLILAGAAAVAIGLTLYIKVYGLGKMVECGECGAFIPEDATTCPKCGVEFEKDMAKCSNCQAWIPVDVKQCPECGVEFATGEVEMADYQEKMRLQYDEVVGKFKEEASRQLGRALSETEFQEWWRKQPTFLTFEDWLKEEEEMRKMGSKPCPTCGTLNSVTATVCHKCGSLMRETARPPSGGSGGSAPMIQTRRPGGTPPSEGPSGGAAAPYAPSSAQPSVPSGTESIPRRVIRKPIASQPVVQKKVIKKPMGEGQEGEGQSDSSSDNSSEDEL